MRQRWIAILLCISMLGSMVVHTVPTVYATEKNVFVTYNEEPIEQLTIQQDEKEILSARTEGLGEAEYQWQILADESGAGWVNIYDAVEPECAVSYALVKNVLNDSDTASIRCKVMCEDAVYYSESIDVTVTFLEESIGGRVDVPKILTSDLVVIEGGSAGPAGSLLPIATPSTATPSTATPSTPSESKPSTDTPGVVPPKATPSTAEPSISETTPSETEPTETLPAETEPGETEPAETEPTETLPAETEPDETEPTETEPTEPGETEPTESESAETTAAETEPTATLPSEGESTATPSNATLAALKRILRMAVATPSNAEEEQITPATPSNAESKSEESSESVVTIKKHLAKAAATPEHVTITIKYLDEATVSGEEASIYSPYVATIEYGSDFAQNIISPTFLGFAPFYDKNGNGVIEKEEDASQISLNLTNVTDNVEIKVYYKPIEVNFAVRYFFQNINDDLYTEDISRYRVDKAFTGTKIDNTYFETHAGDTTGFEKMYHIPEAVAADGSTVFECYYDRNYYLLNFDLAGGYGADSVYARYETPFLVNEPIRHGWHFKGWDLLTADTDGDGILDTGDGNVEALPSTVPPESRRYIAIWEEIDTTYTIAYWLQNANDSNYSFIGQRTEGALSASVVSGSDDLAGAYLCGNSTHTHTKDCKVDTTRYEFFKADQNIVVEGDGSSVVNVYYTRKTYTLRFYYAKTIASTSASTHYVVGGSTYPFGKYAGNTETTKIEELLSKVTAWGKVKEVPTVNETYKSKYQLGSVADGSTTYHYLEFSAKYGSDISDIWPVGIFDKVEIDETHAQTTDKYAYFSAWNGEFRVKYTQENSNQTIKGCYMYLDDQVLFDSTFTDGALVSFLGFWENGANIGWSIPKLFEYNLWVESLTTPGTYELYKNFHVYDNSTVDQQTITSINGLKYIRKESKTQTGGTMEHHVIDFYYDRYDYDLKFYNYNAEVSGKGTDVPFGDSLSKYDFIPDYPSVLEDNAYYFDGWYTTSECYAASKVDMSKDTMPANDLMLYAKWAPKIHTVNFFKSLDAMKAYEADPTGSTPYKVYDTIIHGNVIGEVQSPDPELIGGVPLVFAGWFYLEYGVKKAFSPYSMQVNKDMNIFADWSTNSPQPYCLHYRLLDDRTTKVADDSTGFAYGGSTRTFTAKAGNPYNQLYSAYNSGYFPTVGSHSITMQYEGDYSGSGVADFDNLQYNTYNFYYVHATNIEYRIRYVNRETNTLLAPEVVKTTSDAVVTERFKAFENMVPDSFYKRLVLSVEKQGEEWVGSSENVITFYYTPNTTSAYYAVHYMLEKVDATATDRANYAIDGSGGYEEIGTHVEGVGNIGSVVEIVPQTFSGFERVENAIVIRPTSSTKDWIALQGGKYPIEITKEGTELYIFYQRQSYAYTVHYYLYNTTTPVSATGYPSVSGTARYGTQVTESAPKIDGFSCVSNQNKTITIRGDASQNEIIFYYSPLQYVAEYVAVPGDGGWLSTTIEVITGSEPLKGAVPTANQYYRFDGWYLDADCTISAAGKGTINGTTNQFVPDKSQLSDIKRNLFYAKFVRLTGDLTINRAGAGEADQVFVYEIKDNASGNQYQVTIMGNGSVTIPNFPYGEYTITQQNAWSWRYDDAAQKKVSHQGDTTVQFGKSPVKNQWLNGNSPVVKNQRRSTE